MRSSPSMPARLRLIAAAPFVVASSGRHLAAKSYHAFFVGISAGVHLRSSSSAMRSRCRSRSRKLRAYGPVIMPSIRCRASGGPRSGWCHASAARAASSQCSSPGWLTMIFLRCAASSSPGSNGGAQTTVSP